MLTMRAAAALLTASRSAAGIMDAVRAARLAADAVSLDASQIAALGLETMEEPAMAGGIGSVRVVAARLPPATSIRDALPGLARRLATRAPHVLWLAAVVESGGARAAIVGWVADPRRPRLASFSWEPNRVVDSDAEVLCALSATRAADDVACHARWLELLGRDALTRRFYRALEGEVDALASTIPSRTPRDDARSIALLYVSRLLFLAFLEAKGWLNGERDFVSARFDACMRAGGQFHRRVLLPLFFGTLNTPYASRARTARAFGDVPFLNGGLFTRTPLERRTGSWRFPDETVGGLFHNLFDRFRFVAREDSATWSEASVDPEMLGRAFESLMGERERRSGGVFYTPHELVARASALAIDTAMPRPTLDAVRSLRVLDPACGSGAFLVHAVDRLAELRRTLGDPLSPAAVRRDVLARCVFGVDRNPTAVWLCELRLWLAVVIETDGLAPRDVPPLPNLDRNIRVGDALSGAAFGDDPAILADGARLAALRQRYVRATGARKQPLARALDRAERGAALARIEGEIRGAERARCEALEVLRTRDLFGARQAPSAERRRELQQLRRRVRALRAERRALADGAALPFSFAAAFADVHARGGFDVVLGNPPWVRLHRIPVALRAVFRRSYAVFRSAAWATGADGARAARGFASQVDLAALFVERSAALLGTNGALSLLLPAKLWRSLAGGGVRDLLQQRVGIVHLEDLSESKHAFDAAVYPSLLVARSGDRASGSATIVVRERTGTREWRALPASLPFDQSPGAPWLLLAPAARAAFDRVRAAGVPLNESPFGAPRLGVKSGCNAAFLVRIVDHARAFATVVDADGETGSVERAMLRPALRGDAVVPWARPAGDDFIIWTHDAQGAPLRRLPERSRRWLGRRYDALATRSDAAHSKTWWSLFRTDAADARTCRVVWADFGRRPRALVLARGDPTVPLNTCYVLHVPDERDASALAALLNSPLAAAWLNALAEPARGSYRRYLAWTVGLLPIPSDWGRARTLLAGAHGGNDATLLDATLAAYALSGAEVADLLPTPP